MWPYQDGSEARKWNIATTFTIEGEAKPKSTWASCFNSATLEPTAPAVI